MFLNEPAPTAYDVRFHLGEIAVRVHPMFWVYTLLFGASGGLEQAVLWVGVVFLSILAHEMGHAWCAQAQGGRPRVTLYAMGGLASYAPFRQSRAERILVLLCGPGMGFLLAGAVVAALWISDQSIEFFGFEVGRGPIVENEYLYQFFSSMLFINIVWSLINLLPVYPLDGGQIARELLLEYTRRGDHLSAQISMVVAIAAALAMLNWGSFFAAVLFGFLAFENYQRMQFLRFGDWR